MPHKLRTRAQDEKGFTLIEVLVVVLVIGVLAAIALPKLLGQGEKAQDSSAKSDARNVVSQMESCFTESETYAGCQTSMTSASSGLSIGSGLGQVRVTGTPTVTSYTVVARSWSNRTFTIDHTTAGNARSCGPSGGGCGSGGW